MKIARARSDGPAYRMVFADIDGTLVDGSGRVSPRTASALCRLREAGVMLVLCTGRSRHAASRVAHELGGTGFGIVLNGAVVLDWETGQVLRSSLLPGSIVRSASDIAHAQEMAAVWLGTEDGCDHAYVEKMCPLWPDYELRNRDRLVFVNDFVSLQSAPASLAAYGSEAQAVCLTEAWRRALGADVNATAGPTAAYRAWYAQLTARGADKASAAGFLAGRMGVRREQTLAIGDHHNDVTLLKWAGLGVCMEDGHPDACAAADYITAPLCEEGAAAALERFVLN